MPHVISSDGTPIGYESTGSGPVLIVIGGATQYRAIDPIVTPKLVELLSDQFTVVVYDRRGRGESGDTKPYAVAREVEDLASLIDALGGQVYLFGMSSGSLLAMEVASRFPRQIRAVAVYEPPVNLTRSIESYEASWRQMAQLGRENRGSDMVEVFLGDVGLPPEAIVGFRHSPAWPAFAAIGHTLEYDYRLIADARSAGDTPPTHWQNAIMPVLVLDGDKSFDFTAAAADWMASGLHNAQRITLADQSHDYKPDVIAPVIAVFFNMGSVQVH